MCKTLVFSGPQAEEFMGRKVNLFFKEIEDEIVPLSLKPCDGGVKNELEGTCKPV